MKLATIDRFAIEDGKESYEKCGIEGLKRNANDVRERLKNIVEEHGMERPAVSLLKKKVLQ